MPDDGAIEDLAGLSFEELDALLQSKSAEFGAAQAAWEEVFDKLYGEEASSGSERDELEAELARLEAELARIADTMEAAAAEIERALSSPETDTAEQAGSAGLTPEEEAVARAAEMEELLARGDLADIPEAELAALLDELAGPYTPDVLVYSTPCAVGGTFEAGEGCHVIGHGHFYVDGDGTGVFTPDAYTVHEDIYSETTASSSIDEALDEVFYETSIARPARPGDRFAAEKNEGESAWTVTALP